MPTLDTPLDTFPYGLFRSEYRHIIDEHADAPFALGRHGHPEVVVVPSKLFRHMAEAYARVEEMRRTMPVLLAAAQAGVAFPSETLEALGYRAEFDADRLAAFAAHVQLGATHDEDGRPLSESRVSVAIEPVEEDDLELSYRHPLIGG